MQSVLVTNADLDHVLGLLILREGGRFEVHSTPAVRETLTQSLRLDSILSAFGGISWREFDGNTSPLLDRQGAATGLATRAIFLPGGPPPYAPESSCESGHSIALEFTDLANDTRLLVAPDLGAVTPEFEAALAKADAVLIDGTFWADEELRTLRPGARTATAMGHLPISTGTLELMRNAPARFKAYVHINNTNPILLPGTPEREAVEKAGVIVAEDGWEFEL